MKHFNEDQIRRNDLPDDAFELIHDLCYHHDGKNIANYVMRAQRILRKATPRLTIEECERLTDHARVRNTAYCNCTHVMYDI